MPNGDILQCLPHPPLERRAAHVEGKVQTDSRRLDESDHPDDHGFIFLVADHQPRLRKTILKVTYKSVRIVADPGIDATPLSLDATNMAPNEDCPTAKRMSSFAPPARYCVGVMPSMVLDFS